MLDDTPVAAFESLPLFFSVRDLVRLLAISRRTVFRYLKSGKLPQPVRPSARMLRWHRADIAGVLRYGPMSDGYFHQRIHQSAVPESAG